MILTSTTPSTNNSTTPFRLWNLGKLIGQNREHHHEIDWPSLDS